MKNLHFSIGLILLVVFLFTGDYMQVLLADQFSEPLSAYRMMLRASHIYILMIALVHLVLGAYWLRRAETVLAVAQFVSSTVLVIAAGVLVVAFFLDSVAQDQARVLTFWGVVCSLAGVVLQLMAARWPQSNRHL